MSGLVESATAIMRMAERRLDVVAHNVTNITTPGYKRRVGFVDALARGADSVPTMAVRDDAEQGKLQQTGNPLDLAISGTGYFRVRSGELMLYTRQGQFRRDADGLMVTPQGYLLQQASGGDLVIGDTGATIAADGTVTDGGRRVARIALDRVANGGATTAFGESFFTAPASTMEAADGATVRQGTVETSNVSLGDEMTQSMAALRQAESGARLIQLYDDLMGRAVTAFAGGGQ